MSDPEAPYQRIAAEIRQRIRTGKLQPGDRAPSTRALIRDHGVAMATATKALALLQQERLIHPRPGVGNIVGPPPRRPPAADDQSNLSPGTAPSHRPPGIAGTGASRRLPGTAGAGPSDRLPGTAGAGPSHRPPRTAGSGGPPGTAGASSRRPLVGEGFSAEVGGHPGSVRGSGGAVDEFLSRERVVRVAIGIADADGMPALSMRRIAAELGVSTMALYRYVGGKEALILQMVDTAVGDFPFPAKRPTHWRAGIEQAARLQWAAYRRHLWLAGAITLNRPQIVPNLVMHTDAVLRSVAGFGVDASTAMYAAITVFGYVRGVALNLEPEAQAEQDTGMTADEWVDHQTSQLAELIQAKDLQGFRALSVPNGFDLDFDLDQLFESGLALVLDGLATKLGT